MSAGRLRCCGSSMFLKQKFGLGYRLTLSKRVGSTLCDQPLRDLILKHVPEAQLQSDHGAEITYQLPKHQSNFPQMFQELDAIKSEAQVDSWGISMTTLEEVFLRLAEGDSAHWFKQEKESAKTGREERKRRASQYGDYSVTGQRSTVTSNGSPHVNC